MDFIKKIMLSVVVLCFISTAEAKTNRDFRQTQGLSSRSLIVIDLDYLSITSKVVNAYGQFQNLKIAKMKDGFQEEQAIKEALKQYKKNKSFNDFNELVESFLKPLLRYIKNKKMMLVGLTTNPEMYSLISQLKLDGLFLFEQAPKNSTFKIETSKYSINYDNGVIYTNQLNFNNDILTNVSCFLSRKPITLEYFGKTLLNENELISNLQKQNIAFSILDRADFIKIFDNITAREQSKIDAEKLQKKFLKTFVKGFGRAYFITTSAVGVWYFLYSALGIC